MDKGVLQKRHVVERPATEIFRRMFDGMTSRPPPFRSIHQGLSVHRLAPRSQDVVATPCSSNSPFPIAGYWYGTSGKVAATGVVRRRHAEDCESQVVRQRIHPRRGNLAFVRPQVRTVLPPSYQDQIILASQQARRNDLRGSMYVRQPADHSRGETTVPTRMKWLVGSPREPL